MTLAAAPIPVIAGIARELARNDDPLASFQFKNWAARRIAAECHKNVIYWHAANGGGKTENIAALVNAIMRREPELDGIALPRMPAKVHGILIVPSYKQSIDSTLKALLKLIGDWPHEVGKIAGDAVDVIYVKQRGCMSNDRSRWSTLRVYPHDGTIPKGGRVQLVWCDEPPPIDMLNEALKRHNEGDPFVCIVTGTPQNKITTARGPGWGPLLEMFENCLNEPKDGFLRLQSSLYDNEALSSETIKRYEQAAAKSDERDAILFGKHVDATGGNPFASLIDGLDERCRDPEVVTFTVQREDPNTHRRVMAQCTAEIFDDCDNDDFYTMTVDTGRGMKDKTHDPDGIHLWSRRRSALVLRVSEYLGSFGIGAAAHWIAQAYQGKWPSGAWRRNVEVYVGNGGGYGNSTKLAIEMLNEGIDDPMRRVTQGHDATASGRRHAQAGFGETYQSRLDAMNFLLAALQADSVTIPSRAVLDCLRRCVKDEAGKIVAGPGGHDEDLILAGHAIRLMRLPGRTIPKRAERTTPTSEQTMRDALRQSFGWDVVGSNGAGEPVDSGRW